MCDTLCLLNCLALPDHHVCRHSALNWSYSKSDIKFCVTLIEWAAPRFYCNNLVLTLGSFPKVKEYLRLLVLVVYIKLIRFSLHPLFLFCMLLIIRWKGIESKRRLACRRQRTSTDATSYLKLVACYILNAVTCVL